MTLFEDEARMEVYALNTELIDAVLNLNIKSTLNEYPDWYNTT